MISTGLHNASESLSSVKSHQIAVHPLCYWVICILRRSFIITCQIIERNYCQAVCPLLKVIYFSVGHRRNREERDDRSERRDRGDDHPSSSGKDDKRETQAEFKYAPSKWETVDQSELEAQGQKN